MSTFSRILPILTLVIAVSMMVGCGDGGGTSSADIDSTIAVRVDQELKQAREQLKQELNRERKQLQQELKQKREQLKQEIKNERGRGTGAQSAPTALPTPTSSPNFTEAEIETIVR